MDEKYKYSYEFDNDYCYPNTNVLKNKLGIQDNDNLYEAEREIVAYETTDIIEHPIKGNFDFEHLKAIHFRLFRKIYDWAGKTRNCAIAKKDLFCLPQNIEVYANEIFSQLLRHDYYIHLDYEETIVALVKLFADINALHPFREGNGRTQREFIEELAKVNGIDLNLDKVDQNSMIVASHDSINGNYYKLTKMFFDNSEVLDVQMQEKMIDDYIKSKELKDNLTKVIKETHQLNNGINR